MKCKMGHRWNHQERENNTNWRVCIVCKLLQGRQRGSGNRWKTIVLPKEPTPIEEITA